MCNAVAFMAEIVVGVKQFPRIFQPRLAERKRREKTEENQGFCGLPAKPVESLPSPLRQVIRAERSDRSL